MQEGDLEGCTTPAEARTRKLGQIKRRSSTLSNDCTQDLISVLQSKAENRHTEMVDLVKQTASEMMQQSSRLLETERQDRNARAQQLSDSFDTSMRSFLDGMNALLKDNKDVYKE